MRELISGRKGHLGLQPPWNFRFHDLRHMAASRMAEAGADAFTLAAIFAWSDIRTAPRYTHAMDEAKRRAPIRRRPRLT